MAELAHKGKPTTLLIPMAFCNLNMQGVQRNPAMPLVYTVQETGCQCGPDCVPWPNTQGKRRKKKTTTITTTTWQKTLKMKCGVQCPKGWHPRAKRHILEGQRMQTPSRLGNAVQKEPRDRWAINSSCQGSVTLTSSYSRSVSWGKRPTIPSWKELWCQRDAKKLLIWKAPDAGKDWRQEEKEMTEDKMVRWHRWCNGCEFWVGSRSWDRQGSLACCSLWGCKESDTTELNWITHLLETWKSLICFWILFH